MPIPMPETTERACRHCGCTEMDACPGGCAWVSADECSACRPDRILTFAIKEARVNCHPDKGHDAEEAVQISEAARILEAT